MRKAKAEDYGICCTSCQEDVNVHRCEKCFQRFDDEDEIYCKENRRQDSIHFHKDCKPEEE